MVELEQCCYKIKLVMVTWDESVTDSSLLFVSTIVGATLAAARQYKYLCISQC